jgi:hypothetical protein
MLKKTMIVAALAALIPATALAQDEPPPDGTTTGDATTTPTGDTGMAAMAPASAGPAIFKHGTMGLAFALPAGGFTPAGTANLTWFNDPNTAYDLILGVNFLHGSVPDPAMPANKIDKNQFGFTLGFGMKMYKHHSAKIHTFIEPQILIGDSDVSSFADTISIGVGGFMGAECLFTDWFSVSGKIGVSLDFADKFNTITLSTGTSGLYANLYWD